MAYTTIDKPTDYFNTVLYTGNGYPTSNTQSITGVGFQPDWIWIKARSGTDPVVNHALFDSVRGTSKQLKSNQSNAEASNSGVTSFDSDGFTLGSNADSNWQGNSLVAWNWLAGTSFSNDASATSVGTIDSSGSFNNDAGFSIVSYTGTGSAGTIKHGLNVAPSWIIAKRRGAAEDWAVYHKSLTASKYINLNTVNAVESSTSRWNGVEPTSSVFSVNTHAAINNSSDTYIAYCFAEKKGFSKFGSYEGNGSSDGTFVYTGFKPAFVITKRADTGGDNWHILDNKRDIDNPAQEVISANANTAEGTTSTSFIDFLSNGFKCRGTGSSINTSGLTYIYIAFAENPFVTSTGIPTTAR